jgi:hypothetical protein
MISVPPAEGRVYLFDVLLPASVFTAWAAILFVAKNHR